MLAECALVYSKDVGELLRIFGCGLGLAVEDSCNGYFVAAELLCDVFKGEVLGCFCFEKSRSLNGETIAEG